MWDIINMNDHFVALHNYLKNCKQRKLKSLKQNEYSSCFLLSHFKLLLMSINSQYYQSNIVYYQM